MQVPPSVTCVTSHRSLIDASTQTVGVEAHGHDAFRIAADDFSTDSSAADSTSAATGIEPHLPASATAAPVENPATHTTSEAPSVSHAAGPPAPGTPSTEPAVARLTSQSSSHSYCSPHAPWSLSEVGRVSNQLLWREYLPLTVDGKGQQDQGVGRSRGGCFGVIGRSRKSFTTMHAEVNALAPCTIMQGPLPYDESNGLASLVLLVLCPPMDFIDMQWFTKALIRTIINTSNCVNYYSFVLIPAWLWLLRHHLLKGNLRNAIADLASGLVILFGVDWIQSAADRADRIRRAGMFTASAKSACQLSPPRYTGSSTTASKAAGVPATSIQTKRPGGTVSTSTGRGPSSFVPRPPPNMAVYSAVGSPVPLDRQVRQVKQRIIKLETIVFGNELTEADLSREALGSRVQVLCTEIGVPFLGYSSCDAQPTTAELEQQLHAVERALGVT